jgi:hypothetical protein
MGASKCLLELERIYRSTYATTVIRLRLIEEDGKKLLTLHEDLEPTELLREEEFHGGITLLLTTEQEQQLILALGGTVSEPSKMEHKA